MHERHSSCSLAAGSPGASSDTQLICGVFLGSLVPQASEHLRFDSWPRHWSIGLKTGQNYKISLPALKTPEAAVDRPPSGGAWFIKELVYS
ncbi:hypothetical protein NBRC111894_3819 [Sporolactobacillus inulinus]|uniref:Uncharacterized protein n=1 Tax=Sporolactobacillus inulinus TaxID=2078 RepID=A0A4Y1ZGN0_9BACL|nr:hypothetical protein NBRC111894_3819 [Sporolactobacillus inulinus]